MGPRCLDNRETIVRIEIFIEATVLPIDKPVIRATWIQKICTKQKLWATNISELFLKFSKKN